MRRALSSVIGVLFCCAASAASAVVIPPQCLTEDGSSFYRFEALQGELIVASGDDGVSGLVILAACEANTQLRIVGTGATFYTDYYYDSIISLVASADTYSFEDLAARFNGQRDTIATITPIPADLCSCLSEGQ